ncbi:patched domain-containing protein 3-like, partial [Centruroides sculpturatus]
MKCDCVNRILSTGFRHLGHFIGLHPVWFIVIPILLTTFLGLGFIRMKIVTDIEYLYSPINGRATQERDAVESLFPPDLTTDYDFLRDTRLRKCGNVICTAKNGGTMLKSSIFDDIIALDKEISNISIIWNNTIYTYSDLCCKSHGKCYVNGILALRDIVDRVRENKIKLRAFLNDKNLAYTVTDYGANLGGITMKQDDFLEDIKAIRLFYLLDDSTEHKKMLAELWENEFIDVVSKLHYKTIEVYRFTRSSFNSESSRVTEMSFPLLLVCVPAMVIFAVVNCMTIDWITSKPWIGVAGCLNSGFAIVASFGFLIWCGLEYLDLNISITFLIIGVGLDDSFVILAAWRRTDPKKSVPERLAETYSEAAISITITSVTNIISFCAGMLTPYRIVNIFSIYMAVSVLFDFLFQITFFGGCMAISGYRESRKLHAVFCMAIKPDMRSRSYIYRLLTYGIIHESNKNCEENSGNLLMLFYRDILGKFLCLKWIKALILAFFFVYICGAVYSFRWIQEGLRYQDVLPHNSFGMKYSIQHYKYFTQYPQRIQVIINNTLDYSDPKVQQELKEFIHEFEEIPLVVGGLFTEFWLKYYLKFLKDKRYWFSHAGYNMSDPDDFIDCLRDVFLKFPWAQNLKKDILFSKDGKKIIATRFLLGSQNVVDTNAEKELLQSLWKVTDSFKYKSYVHQFWFIIFNQHIDIKDTTIQTLCIAAVLVTLVFTLFLPNIPCVLCIAFTIVSIEIGLVGYMSAWNVHIDDISMIVLIMSTGFCVDYASHISYAYVSCASEDVNIKLRSALYAAGHPIVQGCISSILGTLVFYFGASNVFIVFLKIVFLVMSFALFHGLFFLPVILSIWDSVYYKIK